MGTPEFAVPSLLSLLKHPELCSVVAVATQPDRPAGRGRKLTASPVKRAATEHGVPVLEPASMRSKETLETLAAFEPDLIVVVAYGKILPASVLNLPQYGCVNVHASLLPRHRGASPVAHAIMAGDPEAGVCIMQMDAGLDTGPVHHRVSMPLLPSHTRGTLTDHLSEAGARGLIEVLPALLEGRSVPTPQDDALSTYAPLLKKEDGLIDFNQAPETISNRIRGLSPWPGAYALLGDKRTLFITASVEPSTEGEPGEVLKADSRGVVIAAPGGALRLHQVRPAGKKAMDAGSWVAGRGVQAGDVFNSPS